MFDCSFAIFTFRPEGPFGLQKLKMTDMQEVKNILEVWLLNTRMSQQKSVGREMISALSGGRRAAVFSKLWGSLSVLSSLTSSAASFSSLQRDFLYFWLWNTSAMIVELIIYQDAKHQKVICQKIKRPYLGPKNTFFQTIPFSSAINNIWFLVFKIEL